MRRCEDFSLNHSTSILPNSATIINLYKQKKAWTLSIDLNESDSEFSDESEENENEIIDPDFDQQTNLHKRRIVYTVIRFRKLLGRMHIDSNNGTQVFLWMYQKNFSNPVVK